MDEPVIARAALRHGLGVSDILHAYRLPIRIWDLGEGFTMTVGAGESGSLLEIGFVRAEDGVVIIHAMAARAKFLR